MNRTLKAIIVAVALIFVGTVLAGCGLCGMNGVWDMLTGYNPLVTTQENIPEDFTNIDIDIIWADLELIPSPDGTCYYTAETYDNMFCTAEVENGTLKIGQDDSRKWYQHVGIYWEETSLKLYLPKDAYDQLTVQADTSDLMIPRDFTFGNVSITSSTGDIAFSAKVDGDMTLTCSTGDITLNGVAAKAITASVSTGDVTMEKTSCDSLSVSTSTGHCHLADVSVTGSLCATSGTGKKFLTNVTCGSLNLKATTGDLEMTNVVASGDAVITCSTGDVQFTGFDAANITIRTSTGDVEGTLLSEKIFFVDTDTGDVEVPRTATGGKCEITTDTGDIEIDIAP